MIRRIIYQHSAGPYPDLRQILALEYRPEGYGTGRLHYLHTGERRILDPGPLPDILAPIVLGPDGRVARAARLITTDKYVVYKEI